MRTLASRDILPPNAPGDNRPWTELVAVVPAVPIAERVDLHRGLPAAELHGLVEIATESDSLVLDACLGLGINRRRGRDP